MTTDGTDLDTVSEAALNDHYGEPDLAENILDALAEAGTDLDALSRDDIASFDEFHIRGRDATRDLARLAVVEPGSRVLDVGCGVGGPARTLAAEFDCTVVGIDVVEAYCTAANRFTERVGLSNAVTFRQANAVDLPFDDDAFDLVWVEHTLMNVAATDRAITEARRVLRPGGRLALYEICAGPAGDPRFPVPWADDPSLSHLDSEETLRRTILDTGFDEVAWEDVTDPSLEWFRNVVDSMDSRPTDAPRPLGINLLMGEQTPLKAKNVVRNLETDRIRVVQGVFE